MRVAVLGTGIMGAPIARNIAAAGIEVHAWNRTAQKAEPLRERGIEVAGKPATAVRGADLLITMLSNVDAVLSVVDESLLEVAGDATWVQMSTIGLEGTARCAELAFDSGTPFIDSPVVGTRQPAEQGALIVLASGPEEDRERCQRVFDAIGQRTLWLGPAGEGTRLKLVANAWLVGVVETLAETIAFAEGIGVEPSSFLKLIAGGPIDSPYAQMKGKMMLERNFETAFPLHLAAKDAALVLDAAAEAGLALPVIQAAHEQMERAAEAGHGDEDMAATFFAAVDSR
jgi:3-hydroxyisobutyrate dehydrogenase